MKNEIQINIIQYFPKKKKNYKKNYVQSLCCKHYIL